MVSQACRPAAAAIMCKYATTDADAEAVDNYCWHLSGYQRLLVLLRPPPPSLPGVSGSRPAS